MTDLLPRLSPGNTAPTPTESPWTLDLLGAPALAFVAYGIPGPQGSKTQGVSKTGIHFMRESSEKVKPWRQNVTAVAVEATNRADWTPLDGFLVADFVFSMPKGSSIPKWKFWHNTTPDLSKLTRATEDALTGVAWKDDARLCAYRRLEKLYVGSPDPDALRASGAVIRLWQIPAHLIGQAKAASRAR